MAAAAGRAAVNNRTESRETTTRFMTHSLRPASVKPTQLSTGTAGLPWKRRHYILLCHKRKGVLGEKRRQAPSVGWRLPPWGELELPDHAGVGAQAGEVEVGAVDDVDVVGGQVLDRPPHVMPDRLDVDPHLRSSVEGQAADPVPTHLVLGRALVGAEQVVGGAGAQVGGDRGVVGEVELETDAQGGGVDFEIVAVGDPLGRHVVEISAAELQDAPADLGTAAIAGIGVL